MKVGEGDLGLHEADTPDGIAPDRCIVPKSVPKPRPSVAGSDGRRLRGGAPYMGTFIRR